MLLKIYRRFPRRLRRWGVRRVTPSFTVGAVCVIEREDGARLLVHQVYRNGWGLPGGLAKRGEEIADCARREVLEEVGVEVELVGEPAVVVDPEPRRIDVIYQARLAPGNEPQAARPCSPEIEDVGWYLAEDMPPLQHETATALVAHARLVNELAKG